MFGTTTDSQVINLRWIWSGNSRLDLELL